MTRARWLRAALTLSFGATLLGCDGLGDTPAPFPSLGAEPGVAPSEDSEPPAEADAGPASAPASGPASAPSSAPSSAPTAGLEKLPGMLPDEFPVPPPPFSEGVFPCMDCHDLFDPDPTRRKLVDDHADLVLHHGDRERWCFDCHNPENRDMLRLASGTLVPFEQSFRLCGQCHGDKLRDWRVGIHGRRIGEWDGKREYLLCAHCHNPHSPKPAGVSEDGTPFPGPITPLPPPIRPGEIGEVGMVTP